ncbi:hypothetical protein V7139_08605 [Neobacillus drentensis]|uniref:hypothetical protein n=1 Tax=Neobacillus drentensis TaxID=220684 RepID=UPI0030010318
MRENKGGKELRLLNRLTNLLKIKNEHLWILGSSLVILGFVLIIQLTYGDKHPDSFLTSLLPNFFADVISVLITTYLLAYLLQKNQEKKEKRQLFGAIKQDYIAFVHKIAGNYLFLITRKEEYIHSEAKGLLDMREGIDSIKNRRELIDPSTLNKSQGEIKNILYGRWRTSLMKFNRSFQTYLEQYAELENAIQDILVKYLNEDQIDDFENMSKSDKERLKRLEDELKGLESDNKFPFITAKIMSYYYNYAVEAIRDFSGSYDMVLPLDMKMAIFRLKNNLDDTVMYSMTFGAYPELSQEKKEQMQKTMSNITKEISFLLDYFKEYEGANL